MIKILNHIKNLDWILAGSALLLSVFSLLSLYDYSREGIDFNFQKQLIFLVIGFILMIVLSFIDWRILKESSFFILSLYFIGIILLLGLFIFAPELRDVKRWYVIGPVSFDPVEFFKIVVVILMAKFFSRRHVEMYKFSHIVLSGIYIIIPSIIIFFQPDMGSAIALLALWIGILILSGIKIKHFLILSLIGILILSLGWVFLLKDYQKQRITSFVTPHMDPQGINWNPEQARIAIGSGGLFGQGLGEGSQTRYGFLPEKQTDFIFSAIAEETGLLGVTVLLSSFLIIVFRILKIAFKAPDNFSRLICSGFIVLIVSQVFINVGMNLGILPIVGIPLPLVSYGGSSLIFTFVGLGIIQNIKSQL